MNKAELITATQKVLSSPTRVASERAVTAVLDGIRYGLRKDKIVQLIGFGTFKVMERKARTGAHPKTGEKIKIKKSKRVKFSVGKDLRSKL